jgi:hypothetical protein
VCIRKENLQLARFTTLRAGQTTKFLFLRTTWAGNTALSDIMHWIKNISTKRRNLIHGSKDHLWGSRFFARSIKDPQEYGSVMNYIDQNAVAVGLASLTLPPIPANLKQSRCPSFLTVFQN